MAQKKVDANILENLKFAFLAKADPDSLSLSTTDVKGLIQYAFGEAACTFEDLMMACFIEEDSQEIVPFESL